MSNGNSNGLETQAPAKKADVTTKLIESFKELISQGVIRAGSKLPPERELSQRFGVSRASLRQALKVLEIMGVVSQRVGDGTYLSRDASTILSEPMQFMILMDSISYQELVEARMIVEPELAARAAERATSADLAALREAIDGMEGSESDPVRRVEQDLAFHNALFRAAGNRVCDLMFAVIHRAMLSSFMRTSACAKLRETIAYHKGIYSAIHARDPEAARQKMIDHLESTKRLLEEAQKLPSSQALADRIMPIVRAVPPRASLPETPQ